MARPLRLNLPDGWYHVMSRGLERRAIFADSADYQHFHQLLEEVHTRYRFAIHAHVEMTSHYHLVVQTPDANLSEGMQWLNFAYVGWYNKRHDRVGPLLQGRYKAVPLEDSAWAYELSLYVHLNPLRIRTLGLDKRGAWAERAEFKQPTAEQVTRRLKRLRSYRWSSYRAYAGYEKAPDWLCTGELLGRAAARKNQRREQYRADVTQRLKRGQDPARSEQIRDALAIGSREFVEKLKTVAAGGARETAGKTRLRQRVNFEQVVAAVEERKGLPWEDFRHLRGDWAKGLVMWAARRYCGLTLAQIGKHFDGMDYAAVSVALKRFEARAREDAGLRKSQATVAKVLNVET